MSEFPPFPFLRSWPTEPRDFIPPDYCSLLAALDLVGRSIFGVEWTGDERFARSEAKRREDFKSWLDERLRLGRSEAPELDEGPNDKAEWRKYAEAKITAEDQALLRRDKAFKDLRQLLYSRNVIAAIFENRTGKRHEVPFELWVTDRAWHFLQSGRADFKVSNDSIYWFAVGGWVFVHEPQLRQALSGKPSSNGEQVHADAALVSGHSLLLEERVAAPTEVAPAHVSKAAVGASGYLPDWLSPEWALDLLTDLQRGQGPRDVVRMVRELSSAVLDGDVRSHRAGDRKVLTVDEVRQLAARTADWRRWRGQLPERIELCTEDLRRVWGKIGADGASREQASVVGQGEITIAPNILPAVAEVVAPKKEPKRRYKRKDPLYWRPLQKFLNQQGDRLVGVSLQDISKSFKRWLEINDAKTLPALPDTRQALEDAIKRFLPQ